MDKKAYLVLEDGTVFEGYAFGAEKESAGELVFTTGMCGYIETLTDESYFGQIVLQTFPMIGNYGIIPQDFEGDCSVKGYAVREKCDNPSNPLLCDVESSIGAKERTSRRWISIIARSCQGGGVKESSQ